MAFAKLSGALLARKEAAATLTLAELVSVPEVAPPPVAAPPAAVPPAAVPPVAAPTPTVPTSPPPVASPPASEAAAQPAANGEADKLLTHYLGALKLPTFLREYDRLARRCAAEGVDPSRYLLRLAQLELAERERRLVERRIKGARFPAVKDLDGFDFAAVPSLNEKLTLELARSEYAERRENIIIVGNSGTGKTHIALGLGLAACQRGLSVAFVTAASLANQLLQTRDGKRLLRLQQRLAAYKVLIIDDLGAMAIPNTGAALISEIVSQRCERGSTIVTSNLPLDKWITVFGTPQLTGAVLERLTYHVHILEMNGESYRLRHQPPQRHGSAGDNFAC
jgi:DNA replication protein DnaC